MKSLVIATLALGFVSGSATAQKQARTVATAEGVVIQMTRQDLPSGKPNPNGSIYIQGGMLRQDHVDSRGHIDNFSIIRDGVIWEVNTQARTYEKMDKATMQQEAEKLNTMLQGMKAQMASMPPERRAMVQAMIDRFEGTGGAAAMPKAAFVDAGKDETSGSYRCHVWEMRVGDRTEMEYCVVPWNSVPGGEQAEAAWKQVAAMMKDMFSSVSLPGLAKMANDRMKVFSDPHGFPVVTRQISGGKPTSQEAVTSIEKQSIPADRFEIPKGFKQVSPLDQMGGMGPGGPGRD